MYKKVFILLLLLPILGLAQVNTTVNLYTFGGLNNDAAEDIAATANSGYIVVGSTSSNSFGNTDVYLLKVDSLCNHEWSKAIGGSNNDWGYSVQQTHDKGYIIASNSNSFGNGGYDIVLMKRDSIGNYQWRKTYGGPDWDFVYSVTQTYDSGYVFCGETYNNTTGMSDVYIVKTNSLGDTLWTKTLGGTMADQGNAVIETSDSSIVVSGNIGTLNDSTDIYVIKLSSTGVILWDSTYSHPGYETANNIIETNDKNYVLTGASTSLNTNNDKDFYLQKIDPNGIQIWTQFFSGTGDEEAFDLHEDINGDLTIVGFTEAFGGGMKDGIVFVINSAGNWTGLGPTYGNSFNEVFLSSAVGKNGNLCAAGYTNSYGNGLNDVLIARFDSITLGGNSLLTNYFDTIPLSVKEAQNKIYVNLYPNPTKNVLNLSSSYNKEFLVKILDITGKEVKRINAYSNQVSFSTINLNNGIYLCEIYSRTHELLYSNKFIIAK